MPRKSAQTVEETEKETDTPNEWKNDNEVEKLTRMLGAVLTYMTDDELVEIDIEGLIDQTEGLRDWWNEYQESNKKQLEDEIKKSLGELSLKELQKFQEKIKEKQS
ncbi:hypothetical protein [Neobacillus niacini]|uniref:hypothetical protein n=1 Tax=Neobacillus niacini TaxID=86668 RepID=UPI0021CB802B|nr:hypothetical protein [Neobacillus niacini]MCM3766040.1 hypothetical protein [Neobacillus niacini]